MSIKIMSAVWELDLPPSDKLVFLALADWARDDGRTWPSIKDLAAKSNLSERTIQRCLRGLETAGLLTRKENLGKGCLYVLTPDNVTPRQPVTPDKVSPTPDTVSPNTLHSVTCITKVMLEDARDLWNQLAKKSDWKEVRKFTPSRNAKLKARLAEHGVDGWHQALTRAAASEWLGHDPPGWFTFDFLVKNDGNILKVLEGNYDKRFGNEKRSAWVD